MKHLLSLSGLQPEDYVSILDRARRHKALRGRPAERPLEGQCWGLIFSKSSTRTRVSFEVGIRELGGKAIFLNTGELQTGRGEPVKDTARVLGRMIHGAVIRTSSHQDVVDFARYGRIPTINALTDQEHPCQILADLMTIQEKLGSWEGRKVCFVGDGSCNVATSWIQAASRLRFLLRIAAPRGYWPSDELRQRAGESLQLTEDTAQAARGADVLYTDVWVSMGMEAQAQERMERLQAYQIGSEAVSLASPSVLVMHCLPAYRGREITEEVLESHQRTIFDQAENRLHAQKGVLDWMAGPPSSG